MSVSLIFSSVFPVVLAENHVIAVDQNSTAFIARISANGHRCGGLQSRRAFVGV